MNFKDRLIRKLLDTGKKHRILVYPTLALVAIISALSHAIYWGRGNGKKLVASIMVMALLITQSLFLTSSADTPASDSSAGNYASGTDANYIDNSDDIDNPNYTVDSNDTLNSDNTMDLDSTINPDDIKTKNNTINPDDTEKTDDTGITDNTEDTDDIEPVNEDINLQGEAPDEIYLYINRVYADGSTSYEGNYTATKNADDSYTFNIKKSSLGTKYGISLDYLDANSAIIYSDKECTNAFVNLNENDGTNVTIDGYTNNIELYIKGTREYYDVQFNEEDGTVLDSSHKIKVNGATAGDLNPPVSFTITKDGSNGIIASDLYLNGTADTPAIFSNKKGYTFNGIRVNGENTIHSFNGGTSIGVNVSNPPTNGAIQLYLQWTPMDYTTTYYIADSPDGGSTTPSTVTVTGNNSITKEYEYGNAVSDFPLVGDFEAAGVSVVHEAYRISGWYDPDTGATYSSSNAMPVTAIQSADAIDENGRNIKDKELYAVWEYIGVEISAASETEFAGSSVDNTNQNVTISSEYGNEVAWTIAAQYVDGETTTSGTKFTYQFDAVDSTTLSNYGLNYEILQDAGIQTGIRITGKIKDITTNKTDVPSLTLTVTDGNKDAADNTIYYTIIFDFEPRVVIIKGDSVQMENGDSPSKTYDGDSKIEILNNVEVDNIVTGDSGVPDDVYVVMGIDPTATTVNADFEDEKAGENKNVILHNVSLGGSDNEKYTLGSVTGDVTVEGIGTINYVSLSVIIEPSDVNVLFGQKTPAYTITIANPQFLVGNDRTIYDTIIAQGASQASLEAFMQDTLGFETWETERTLYSAAGSSYTIEAKFNKIGKNYAIADGSNRASITVVRDKGVSGVNYTYTTNPDTPVNGYYRELTISPLADSGYDTIRMITGSDYPYDFSDSLSDDVIQAMLGEFKTEVKVPDMTDGTVQFQMRNSQTGAITEVTIMEHIYVDSTVPEYVTHTVSPDVSYFNEFNFGSYYHTQDGMERYSITFEYEANYSDCDELHYYFLDEDNNYANNTVDSIVQMSLIEGTTNRYQGTITLGTEISGQLVVYATNLIGGTSAKIRIKLDSSDIYNENLNYYEWMMENNPIDTTSIVVKDKAGAPVVGESDSWFNGLDLSVDAQDNQSGVWKIEWTITDSDGNQDRYTENVVETVGAAQTTYAKVKAFTFKHDLSGDDLKADEYTISAVVYDCAGNTRVLDAVGPYKLDCQKPVITDTTPPLTGDYQSDVTMSFTVSDVGSGVDTVQLKKGDEVLSTWSDDEGTYSYKVTGSGTYTVTATDKAGNTETFIKTFEKVSDVAPEKPELSIEGTIGNNDWYIGEAPIVHIKTKSSTTTDGVPVTTSYIIKTVTTETERAVPGGQLDYPLSITNSGNVIVEAWSTSAAGVESEHVYTSLNVDIEKPDIRITESSTDSSGKTVINFLITDNIGVDLDKVKINGKAIKVSDVNGTVTGSFTTDGSAEYVITAYDLAGNISDDVSFVPLRMTVSPVLNITSNGAYIEADVYKGTYDIADCYIAYKLASDSSYKTCLANKYNESYGIRMNYTFNNLKSNTVYDYKVYAITKTSKEVALEEGSFRTSTTSLTSATVYGSATYSDDLISGYDKYPIYVSMYSANTYIASAIIDEKDDGSYTFKNIADGAYRIVATDGRLTKTKAVTIRNGGIVTPTDYATANGINFVLDGMSTSVVIEDNSINITADELDSIYDTSISEAVITRYDKEVLNNGGTINVTLYASYLDVSELSPEEASIFRLKMADNTEIVRYINLYIIKEVKDADGNYVNSTPVRLSELYNPITISFPLGDLAGQEIYVASVHGEGNDYSFINWSNADDITLAQDYVTITTRFFSVYALYRVIPSEKTYKVVWKDGDGNTMKTETVKEGTAATPPSKTPTKTASGKYTYEFSGWDTDYSSITKDTIISACFTAHKIENDDPDPTTEEEPDMEDPTTDEDPTTESPTTEEDNPDDGNQDGAKDTTVNKTPNGYTYLGSADSPKTGDMTPIVLIVVSMVVSGAGVVVLRKKMKAE